MLTSAVNSQAWGFGCSIMLFDHVEVLPVDVKASAVGAMGCDAVEQQIR